ncbi:hypothetical protein B0A50_01261 [Salinomyces thailandicus]|uniref:Membrane-associated proteins in eicosanoid and glutathione metabolism n=1 Tax=Salinomyces thailandicus TaxID=706561 RepID=A0A4U0UCH8_9PEZI|nr:hypothetical protein B0A50_01261 [Salinomyces thailandica]
MASYLPDLARDNISFYFVPAAWVLAMMPRFYAVSTYRAATKKSLDNNAVREWSKTVSNDQALDSTTKGRILRAEAAQANGFENLGLFAAAIAAGNAAGLSPSLMNGLGGAWLASRFAYNHIYIYNDIVPSAARSLTYISGMGMCMAMFVMAGNKMRSGLLGI